MKIRCYRELCQLTTYEERYEYLKLSGVVGRNTFGFDRFVKQDFYYKSKEWKRVRAIVIARDNGCDLGCPGYEINGQSIYIHHMNPIDVDDIRNSTDYLLNPEYLITTIHSTHNAIHYGDKTLLNTLPVDRRPGDTCPWKHL